MYDLCFLTGHLAVAVTPAESSGVFCDIEALFPKKEKHRKMTIRSTRGVT